MNETDCNRANMSPRLSWSYAQILWTIGFSIILVTAVVGNTIVLWIITAHKCMWSITNYFLINLTVSDLLMVTFNMIPSFIYMRDRVWIFGGTLCKMNNFIIVTPLADKKTVGFAWFVISAIWTGSIALASPALVFSQEISFNVYNIVFFLLTYVFPMIVMAVCYTQMGCFLSKYERERDTKMIISRNASIKIRKNKKKMVKMFAVVVVIFVVCWAPYHIYFIYSYHNPHITKNDYIGHIYLLFYWLAMCQTCVNPIIYYWMNRFSNKIQSYHIYTL